jgi:hypothetical protein
MDYIDKVLTEVKYEDIVKVSADGPDGSYVIVKDSDQGSVLTNIPAGKRAKTSEVQQVFSALSNPNLAFDDVKKDSGKMKFDKTYMCQLKDSTVYTVSLSSKGNKTYAKWTADFMDKSAVVKRMGIESEAELKAKEAKLLARDKAEEFTKKTQGWMYEIPESQAKILTMKFTDLIEDEPKNSGDANKTMSADPSKRVPYDPNKTMPYNPNKTNK